MRLRGILAVSWVSAMTLLTVIDPLAAQQPKALRPPGRPVLPSPAPDATQRPPAPTSDDTLVLDPEHPPVLPAASRAKMHACGREWQAMKRRGADKDTTWRQFATSCLVR